MTRKTTILLTCVALSSALSIGTRSAGAHNVATSELLLPYFEVSLSGTGVATPGVAMPGVTTPGVTTLLSVVNSAPEPVPVTVSVHTTWGIEVLSSATTIDGHAVLTADLRSWLVAGRLPGRDLSAEELEHCQAALSGRRSPRDGLYYGGGEGAVAVGYVKIRAGNEAIRRDVLFGEYFVVEASEDFAQGDFLVDLAAADCPSLCQRHGVRFLSGGGFDAGTEIVIWTDREIRPSASPHRPQPAAVTAEVAAYRESGRQIGRLELGLAPLQVARVSELGLPAPFGWLDVVTDRPAVVTVRLSAANRYSVGFRTFCLPPPAPAPPPPRTAALTVVNRVINDDWGVLDVDDFPLFVNGRPVASGVVNVLRPGTYTASEQERDGYTAGPWEGDCTADGVVTLAPGEHKVCEITNDDKSILP